MALQDVGRSSKPMDQKRSLRMAVMSVAMVSAAVLFLLAARYVNDGFRHGRCQSGEDDAIEREFENGERMNCDDLRPSWPW